MGELKLDMILYVLRDFSEIGVWDILTAVAALNLSFFFVYKYRKRLPLFSIHISYCCGSKHPLYPNVLVFEIRNLMDAPIVVSRPNFRFSSNLKPGNGAHGNSATGDFEVKFRPINSEGDVVLGHSYTSILLRHRDSAFSYMPIDDELSEADLLYIINKNSFIDRVFKKNKLGSLSLSVVVLRETSPLVVPMDVPVSFIHKYPHVPKLGFSACIDK